ncbi:BBP7 family outer membrane beta-barrel protein [Allorhodopirellula solitaria]|uniref:Stigma-specific protein, Stig1 n=1 Tax=Allorhodopirellula solitaria TaxID=2527987 RepID=A0A5C5YEX1_9BACT|nr:BBP7 family outer membrane beta-barrel protein [Allorhodopirellula solitaria]TWT72875.1 hypothetical protein CA85_13360 [Allorhodopirellula solitaria]
MNPQARQMNAVPMAGKLLAITLVSTLSLSTSVTAQVRTKLPDRATYNPAGPAIPPAPAIDTQPDPHGPGVTEEPFDPPSQQAPLRDASGEIEPVNLKPLPSMVPRSKARVLPLANQAAAIEQAAFEQPQRVHANSSQVQSPAQRQQIVPGHATNPPRRQSHARETLIQHTAGEEIWVDGGSVSQHSVGQGTASQGLGGYNSVGSGNVHWNNNTSMAGSWSGDSGCDQCSDGGCNSCDGYYGDCNSCDGLGCGSCDHCGLSNASLSLDPGQWFGSLELLLLFREGDSIPALVTTSPPGTEGDVAGQLPGATILAGGEQAFKDLTAGGRLTLGTWLDDCRDRSLVFRGWTATEADYSYSARQGINSGSILAVPTTNAGSPDSLLVAFPDSAENFGRFGSVNLQASSNVYGGDISVRQFLTGGLGTTFDVLYGYQYMHLDEDLQFSTTSTKTQDPFPAQIGNTLSTSDRFEATNNFHGGQFGFAGNYREGCWSFDWLGKIGFGQIKRQAERRGSSVITTDTPPPAVNDTGLLVGDANSGSYSSSTFGWVPEFDVSVGWHKYPRFDVTFGYNIIAMTDAVRLSGIMDPNNTLDTPRTGAKSGTFMMQGMHFGIRHVW